MIDVFVGKKIDKDKQAFLAAYAVNYTLCLPNFNFCKIKCVLMRFIVILVFLRSSLLLKNWVRFKPSLCTFRKKEFGNMF